MEDVSKLPVLAQEEEQVMLLLGTHQVDVSPVLIPMPALCNGDGDLPLVHVDACCAAMDAKGLEAPALFHGCDSGVDFASRSQGTMQPPSTPKSSSIVVSSSFVPNCKENLKPVVGMAFDSIVDVERFYKDYAHDLDFQFESDSKRRRTRKS